MMKIREEFEEYVVGDLLPSCRECLDGEINFKEIDCIAPEDPIEKK
jgi:hypothetical protein